MLSHRLFRQLLQLKSKDYKTLHRIDKSLLTIKPTRTLEINNGGSKDHENSQISINARKIVAKMDNRNMSTNTKTKKI